MPRIIALSNQKGGVGKTTTTVSLAGALAGHLGLSTLVIDMDAQRNATRTILGSNVTPTENIWSVLYDGAPIEDVMVASPHSPNLFVVPGSEELAYWEKKLDEDSWDNLVFEGRRILRERFPTAIDVVLIDTPPSLGLWLQTALAAADGIVIVVKPDKYSASGIKDLLKTVAAVQERVNPDLYVEGVVITDVKANANEHATWVNTYRSRFGNRIFEPPILNRIVFAEAQSKDQIIEFYRDRKATDVREWFRQIAEQLMARTIPSATASEPAATAAAHAAG